MDFSTCTISAPDFITIILACLFEWISHLSTVSYLKTSWNITPRVQSVYIVACKITWRLLWSLHDKTDQTLALVELYQKLGRKRIAESPSDVTKRTNGRLPLDDSLDDTLNERKATHNNGVTTVSWVPSSRDAPIGAKKRVSVSVVEHEYRYR